MTATARQQLLPSIGKDSLATIAAYLASQDDVVAAYLFGSRARQRSTPRSDLDIAVLLAGAPDVHALAARRLQLIAALEAMAPCPVDVVILNGASSVLQMEVLRARRRLYERDRMARVDFEARVMAVYADEQPHRDFFKRVMLDRASQGRFGGHGRRPR